MIRRLFLLCAPGLAVVPATAQPQWGQEHKLLSADGAAGDLLGRSIAAGGTTISAATVIVGVPGDDRGLPGPRGAALFFDGTTGNQIARVEGAHPGDQFGMSVALSGGYALVGTPGDGDNGILSGSASVFDVATEQLVVKLLADDGSQEDQFGYSVAISGNIAVVGARDDRDNGRHSGSVYVFNATTGEQLQKIVPADGAPNDHFGNSVALSGNTIAVGAPGDAPAGSVYLFDATTWQQLGKLVASDAGDGPGNDAFGTSLAMDAGVLIVGAFGDDDNGGESGSAYLFDTRTRQQTAKLLPLDGGLLESFGFSVGISGNTAVVGAMDYLQEPTTGAAYVFDVSTGTQVAKLARAGGSNDDFFGHAVAALDALAVVAAPNDLENGAQAGAAYVFSIGTAQPGSASCFGTGCPCANDDDDAGCANSTGEGAAITGVGTARTSADDLVLFAQQLPLANSGLFYVGDAQSQTPFYDGFQCALGTTFRFLNSIQNSGDSGTIVLGPGIVAAAGGLITAGSTWHFHAWHRDVPGTVCGTGANLTSLYSVTFVP